MFYGALNVQIGGELLKIQYPNISDMGEVEHIISLFLMMLPKYQL